MSAAAPPRLSLRDVRRSFGKVVAVAGVDLDVRAGAVHALLGENSAGKSTLMNVVYGVTRADAGTISVDGELVQIGSSADAIDAGIAMVHQHHRLIPSLTVAEALVLASPRERWRLDLRSAARRTRILADELGLEVDPGARIQDLSLGARQRVEILTAVQRDARLLILDEPTAVLAPGEIDPLFALLRRMAASGRSIILITHRMGEVFAVRTDLRDAKGRPGLDPRDCRGSARSGAQGVVTSGPLRPAAATAPKGQQTQVVLQVDGLLVAPSPGSTGLQQLSLSVGRGEIVGVAGVEGNGQHALVEVLAGVRKQDSGTVTVDGRLLDVKERRDVISVVPEDRHREGLVLDLSTSETSRCPGSHPSPRRDCSDAPACEPSPRRRSSRTGSSRRRRTRLSEGCRAATSRRSCWLERSQVCLPCSSSASRPGASTPAQPTLCSTGSAVRRQGEPPSFSSAATSTR